ncbi:MAG: RNA polymerase sigma factor FliA [Burkholderiales bacterium]|nr:RNA polymerase sigma factor FliA [Burkholderiales bacterium]OJX09113.1 MAG: RNA polymerase sigma factor FliA [Burkholderiales bacterium 70-64]
MYTAQGTLDRESAIDRYGSMVRRIASQLIGRLPANVEFDDLVQAGMIGLFDAMKRYETDRGAQFETFATQRVRGAMLDELRGADWLPRSVRRSQRTIESGIHRAEQRLGRAASESEIAGELGLGLEEYQHLLADARGAQLVHIDDHDDADEEGSFVERTLAAPGGDPFEVLGDVRFRHALAAAIERLPERERLVMGMYYEQDMNLKEIGAVLGVTESRISQLHSQAVARLRTQMKHWT